MRSSNRPPGGGWIGPPSYDMLPNWGPAAVAGLCPVHLPRVQPRDRCDRGCCSAYLRVYLRPGRPHYGGRPGHSPPPAPTRPPAVGLTPGRAAARTLRRRAARIRRPSPGLRPFALALCGCYAPALLCRRLGPGRGPVQVWPCPGRPRGSAVGSTSGMRGGTSARPDRMAGPTGSLNRHLPQSPPLTLPPRPTPPGHTVPHGGAFGGGLDCVKWRI
jgi:hypothetical protein